MCGMWVKACMSVSSFSQFLKDCAIWPSRGDDTSPQAYHIWIRVEGFVKNNRLHLFPIYSSCVYGDTGVIQERWKARGSQYNSVGWSFEGKTIWCMYLVCGSFLHALFLPRYNGSSRSFSTWYPETVPTNSFKTTEMRTKLSGSLTNKRK